MADSEPSGGAVVPADGRGDGPSALRASHADRDQVAEQLRVAAGDGRLSPEELDERLELALTARTYAELAGLVADLPAAGTATSGAALSPAPDPAAKDLIRLHCTSGNAARGGRWVVPAKMDLKVTSGNIRLDFSQAVITRPTLHIDAEVGSGHITLVTKPGIVVDADDVVVRSGHVKVHAPWGTDVPALLRIDIAGRCGSGNITARPPRRSFWQWLRRAPRPYAIRAGGPTALAADQGWARTRAGPGRDRGRGRGNGRSPMRVGRHSPAPCLEKITGGSRRTGRETR